MKRAFCKFHRSCYFSDEIKGKGREKSAIRRGRAGLRSFVILFAENPSEQLEIVHSAFLRSPRYKEHPPLVLGVAKSRQGAFCLVARISRDASLAGMPGDLRGYMERLA